MSILEKAGLALFHRMDPERAHGLALMALRSGLPPVSGPVTSDRLRTRLAGLSLSNPVGLAAGFDKNAVALAPLSRAARNSSKAARASSMRPRLARATVRP